MLDPDAGFVQRATRHFPSLDKFLALAVPAFEHVSHKDGRGRPMTHAPQRTLAAMWMVGRTGAPWRMVETMSGIAFTTVHHHFARLARLGFWKHLAGGLLGLVRAFHAADPSVGSVDSQSIPSAPSCGVRGIDGAKKIKGIRLTLVCDRHSLPLALRADLASRGERDALLALVDGLREEWPGVATLLADMGYKGAKFAQKLKSRGYHLVVKKCGDGKGRFQPTEIRWTVERSFAWLQSWRRTAIAYERKLEHFEAFAFIAFSSIMAAWLSDIGMVP